MNKEKQIEEMARDMCEYYYEGTCYQDKKPCDVKCEIMTEATYLYAKGYRKASDVIDEFAERLKERFSTATRYTKYSGAGVVMVIDQIANEMKGADNG